MDKMSVSSLATTTPLSPPTPSPVAKPPGNGDVRTDIHRSISAKTPFANILSRGKATANEDQAPSKSPVGAEEAEQQPAVDAAIVIADDTQATSADLSIAVDQGVSAVLALLAAAQAAQIPGPVVRPPADPATTAVAITAASASAAASAVAAVATASAATVASDASATAVAAAAAAASDASPVGAVPAALPKTAPSPLDIAKLSPADQQLLRSMAAAFAAEKSDMKGQSAKTDIPTADGAIITNQPIAPPVAATVTPAASTTTAPEISAMAAALNRTFGRTGDKPSLKTSPPAAVAAEASPATTAGADTSRAQPPLDAAISKHAADTVDAAAPVIGLATKADDGAVSGFVPIIDGATVAADMTTSTIGIPQPGHAEQSVTRHLDMLRDTQWLDTLAHDISVAANQDSHLKFQINPEHLGSLAIEITHGEAGASIRMTTDNDHARAIIADAQPRLLAEVRAQGLRVADSHVDLGSQANGGGNANNRSPSEDHKPFVRTQVGTIEEVSDSPPRDDELYA
jgi:flagellar hook-length control protein FliK